MEDITIKIFQPVVEVSSVSDRQTAETILRSFTQMLNFEFLGPIMTDLDALFEFNQLPSDESLLMDLIYQVKDQDLTIKELLTSDLPIMQKIAPEIRVINQSIPREEIITLDVALSIIDEIKVVFPGIAKIIETYKGPEDQPVVGAILDEIYQLLKPPVTEE